MALAELEAVHLRLGKEMFEAFGGAMYGMDLLAAGALNRSKAHIAGFSTLIKAKNLICSGALLRLQLDTAMRFFAAFLVERPHDFAMSVLRGEKVRDLKDRSGKKMTDVYLCQKLGEEFEWVPRVYERTSGYVHLSSTHLMSALSPSSGADADDWTFTIKISAEDKPLPETGAAPFQWTHWRLGHKRLSTGCARGASNATERAGLWVTACSEFIE